METEQKQILINDEPVTLEQFEQLKKQEQDGQILLKEVSPGNYKMLGKLYG